MNPEPNFDTKISPVGTGGPSMANAVGRDEGTPSAGQLHCCICGAAREDRRISVWQKEGEADRPYCNDNPVCMGLVRVKIATDLYVVEAIKPNGQYALTIPLGPRGMPKHLTTQEEAEWAWSQLEEIIPKIEREGTVLRLVQFHRAEQIHQHVISSKATSLAA